VELLGDFQHKNVDYALVSLVRTERDDEMNERVLASMFSRATRGIYLFGRWQLYSTLDGFNSVKQLLEAHPKKLVILPTEQYDTPVDKKKKTKNAKQIESVVELGKIVYEKSIHLAQES
jgi:hypothetical protein